MILDAYPQTRLDHPCGCITYWSVSRWRSIAQHRCDVHAPLDPDWLPRGSGGSIPNPHHPGDQLSEGAMSNRCGRGQKACPS